MAKTLVVCGYGPGISAAVAERFGREGFAAALVARSADRLAAGVASLEARGIRAAAFPADLVDEAQVRRMVDAVRVKLGPVTVLHWNAYSGAGGDLLAADSAVTRAIFELPVVQLLTALKAALPDLTQQPGAALLVTNGGFGLDDAQIDAAAASYGAMGLAVANAAKQKLVGMLAHKLKPQSVYVGEVMVLSSVKGSAWDDGTAKLEPATIAQAFFDLYTARRESTRRVG
jgi:NADP-dependent 3-hydroxy acid dehydrogenase YdfG